MGLKEQTWNKSREKIELWSTGGVHWTELIMGG
jgi:hypothetical protein